MVGKAQKLHFGGGGEQDLNCILFLALKKWIGGTPLGHPQYSPDLAPCNSGLFQPWKGSSEARYFEVINSLQHVFAKWLEFCKKCIAKGGASKKKLSLHFHKVLIQSNKVSPRNFQTALVY
jgi:hypothetical protein